MLRPLLFLFLIIIISSQTCSIDGCLQCQSSTSCQICHPAYFLINNICQLKPSAELDVGNLNFDGIGGELDRFPQNVPSQFPSDSNGDTGFQAINQDQLLDQDKSKIKKSSKTGCIAEYNGECVLCQVGYKLENKQCSLIRFQKCLKLDENNLCEVCSEALLSTGEGDCYDPKCRSWGHYKCDECYQGFLVDGSGICYDPNCLSYGSGFCQQCIDGMRLQENNKNLCVAEHHCSSYYQEDGQIICTECMEGYYLSERNCLNICFQQSEQGTCNKCVPGYELSSSKSCHKIPSECEFTYFDQDALKCRKCKSGSLLNIDHYCIYASFGTINPDIINLCQVYSADLKCISCLQNYVLDQKNTCFKGTLNCATYSSNVCTQCQKGYQLTSQKLCTNIENCALSQNGICSRCKNGYFLQNGQCMQNDPLCQSSSSGICTNCYQGYTLVQGKCIQASTFENCLQIQNGVCVKCKQNYKLSLTNSCEALDKYCSSFNSATKLCQTCYSGYLLKNGKCQVSPSSPATTERRQLNCRAYNSVTKKCIQCYPQFFLVANGCEPADTLCKTFNPVGGACTSCYDGYTLFNGKCTIGTIGVSNCKEFDELTKTCKTCSERFYKGTNGKCLPVSDTCKTYQITTGKCSSCYDGYRLISGSCSTLDDPNCKTTDPNNIKKCLQCIDRFYVSPEGKCTAVQVVCNKYNADGSCKDCINSYIMFEGKCIQPSLGYDIHCCLYQRKDTIIVCKQCDAGYKLVQYKCEPVQ